MADMKKLPYYSRAEDVPVPKGWAVMRVEDIHDQLPVGQRRDSRTCGPTGDVPVVDQSASGYLGFHSDEPGIIASDERPIVTFANHTCEMRVMRQPFSVIQNVFPKVGKEGVATSLYLYYATRGRIGSTSYKGHHPEWREGYLPVPPLPAQDAITSVLLAYDELIENNLRRIEILEEMAQAIYREWFVNFHFPGSKHPSSSNDEIPNGWVPRLLSEVAVVNGSSIKSATAPDEIQYIDIASVSHGNINEVRSLSFSDAPSRARRRLQDGDTIWSTVRPNLQAFAYISSPDEDTIASTGFAVLTPYGVPPSFLYYSTTTPEFTAYLVNRTRGAAYPAVSGKDFEEAEILMPPENLLERFDQMVAPMQALAHQLRSINRNLRATRDLLLPKLISGEIDVSNLDIDTSWLAA